MIKVKEQTNQMIITNIVEAYLPLQERNFPNASQITKYYLKRVTTTAIRTAGWHAKEAIKLWVNDKGLMYNYFVTGDGLGYRIPK